MKTLKNLIIAFLGVSLLSGCEIYGGPRHHQGENQATYSAAGAVTGAALGAMTGDPRIAILGGVAGGVLGMEYGRDRDRADAALGMTSCKAVIHRSYNRDGTISEVFVNDERCQSFKTTPGYRDGYNR